MIRNIAAALAVVLALTAAASPTLAQQRAKPAAGKAASGDRAMSKHRSTSMRECNDKSNKFTQYTWGVTQSYMYMSCMAGHREMD